MTRALGLAALALVLLVAVVVSLAVGTRDVAFESTLAAIFSPDPSNADHVAVRDLRLPRTVIGIVAGAALAVAGAVMQGLSRNPLADPGLLGVNAGASLFVVIAITWLGVSTASGFVWFALVGAGVATVATYLLGGGRSGNPSPITLTLAGSAVTAVLTSLITLVLISNLETLNEYRFWAVGSLAGRDWSAVGALAPFLAVGAVLAVAVGRALNVLALGPDVARGLGQSVVGARILCGIAIVLLCGSATALAGPIAFVGLVVPHIARRWAGVDYRWIVAFCALIGPSLVLVADVLGRLIVQPAELEAGIVVAFLGAPVLIALVRRSKVGVL